jgi:hypothetical protein
MVLPGAPVRPPERLFTRTELLTHAIRELVVGTRTMEQVTRPASTSLFDHVLIRYIHRTTEPSARDAGFSCTGWPRSSPFCGRNAASAEHARRLPNVFLTQPAAGETTAVMLTPGTPSPRRTTASPCGSAAVTRMGSGVVARPIASPPASSAMTAAAAARRRGRCRRRRWAAVSERIWRRVRRRTRSLSGGPSSNASGGTSPSSSASSSRQTWPDDSSSAW